MALLKIDDQDLAATLAENCAQLLCELDEIEGIDSEAFEDLKDLLMTQYQLLSMEIHQISNKVIPSKLGKVSVPEPTEDK